MQQILPTRRRTSKGFWQLTALALAAGAFCVAQAQNLGLLAEAEESIEPAEVVIESTTPPSAPVAEASSSEESKPTAETTAATPGAEPGISPRAANGQTVVVTPQTASQPAQVVAEDRPPTREEVVADAIYANTHGLIPRGELSVLHEDKGMLWAEQMAQAGDLPQRLAMR